MKKPLLWYDQRKKLTHHYDHFFRNTLSGGPSNKRPVHFVFQVSVCHKLRSRDPFYGGRERALPATRKGISTFYVETASTNLAFRPDSE